MSLGKFAFVCLGKSGRGELLTKEACFLSWSSLSHLSVGRGAGGKDGSLEAEDLLAYFLTSQGELL